MRIRSIRYYLNEAMISLFRNRLMALASVVTVAACMLTVTLSYCVAVNLDEMLVRVENSVGLTAYIAEEVPDEDISALYEKVKAITGIKSIAYISSETALEQFREELGDDGDLLAGFEADNLLPRSFNIEVNDARQQREIIALLEGMQADGIYEVKHQQDVVDALGAINQGVRVVSLAVILILLITSVVIIMNTIRLTVINRKLEINIMKYVGATDSFIRWPFIIEGILIGLIGAGVPVLLCWAGYPKVTEIVSGELPAILNGLVEFQSALSIFSFLLPLTLVIGALIGAIGSIVSVHRHLHV